MVSGVNKESRGAVSALVLSVARVAVEDYAGVTTGGASSVKGISFRTASALVRSSIATDAVVDVATETLGQVDRKGVLRQTLFADSVVFTDLAVVNGARDTSSSV